MRIRPYIKDGDRLSTERNKFRVGSNGGTQWEKQEVKNANRAIKKAYRMQLKQETKKLIKKIINKEDYE